MHEVTSCGDGVRTPARDGGLTISLSKVTLSNAVETKRSQIRIWREEFTGFLELRRQLCIGSEHHPSPKKESKSIYCTFCFNPSGLRSFNVAGE